MPSNTGVPAALFRTNARKVMTLLMGGFLAAIGTYLRNQFLNVAEKPFENDALIARLVTEAGSSSHPYAPYFVVPRYIEIVDVLPMTPSRRVENYKLRDRGGTSATWDLEASDFVVER